MFQELTNEELVELYLGKEMIPVIKCESQLNQFNPDDTPLLSETGDVGIAQVNQIWWDEAKELGLDIFNSKHDNLKMARKILEIQGRDAWMCNSLVYGENVQPGLNLSLPGVYVGECVEYVKQVLGEHPDFVGDARDIQPNKGYGARGDVILLDESEYGHVAVIANIVDGKYILSESNLDGDGLITIGREISPTDPRIRGFFDFDF